MPKPKKPTKSYSLSPELLAMLEANRISYESQSAQVERLLRIALGANHGHLVELHQGGTVTVKEGQSVAQAFMNPEREK